ncbi:MAG: polysaccharide biosynthesis/export family protein, partial [Thermoguttaceae bacterium]
WTGSTTVNAGTLQLGNGGWESTTFNGTLNADSYPRPYGRVTSGITIGGGATPTPTTPIPAGPVFYIITEGAGLGDSVRSVPCTGKETVLDAVGQVNGISQLSSTKIWIARPAPASRDKSTILSVDWEAISRRGINTTNYTLMPGDRLVFGEDPLITRSNLLGKKSTSIERTMGIVGLTTSTLNGLNGPPADSEVLKELVRKGFFTDDEQLKQLMLDAIRLREQENKKDGPKATAEQKASQKAEKSNTGGPILAAEQKASQGEEKSNTAGEAPPHELAMRPLPAYRIEPPDVITIELLKLVPLPPYRAGIFDVLQIRANSLPDQPIDNNYMVDTEGKINLGPTYHSVRVAGMTIDEMTTTLNKWLRQWLRDPDVNVQLAKAAGVQPVTGQYLVAPDGTVNLRLYGRVSVAGKTVAEARLAIEKQLATYLKSPELSVDIVAYNSKAYYVITQGAGLGDSVRRLPITGKETVLDAISQVNGLSQVSSKNIWIVRPSASDAEKGTILPVDWDGITGRGATATNYQILPGDRVFIGEDPLVTRANLLGKTTAPIERIMGVVGLTTSTLGGLNGTPVDNEVLKEFVRKGMFADDERLKNMLWKVIRLREVEREKARSKEAEKSKPGQ